MSVLAWALVQTQPEAPKIGSRLTPPGAPASDPGMWSAVFGSKGTTSNSVRSKADGNALLITVLVPVPVVGGTPAICLTTIVPVRLQLNWFFAVLGAHGGKALQLAFEHVAEWKCWAIQSPIEYGKIALGDWSSALTPSFSSSVAGWLTHGP